MEGSHHIAGEEMRATTFAAALVLLATSAAAQTTPSFAGQWTSAPDPAATPAAGRAGGVAPSMGSGWGSTITITQDVAQLVVEYAFFGRGDMQAPLKFTYALNGSPTKNSVMMGHGIQVQTSRAIWEGQKLAITTTSQIPNPAGSGAPLATEIKQVLSLESPTSLVVEATRAGLMGGNASTTRTVYRKL